MASAKSRYLQRVGAALAVLSISAVGIGLTAWFSDRQQRLDRQLLAAIDRQDTPAALRALAAGADANASDAPAVPLNKAFWLRLRGLPPQRSDYEGALIRSLKRGSGDDTGLVRALIERGADVNAANDMGWPAVWLALSHRNPLVAATMVEHSADLRTTVPAWYFGTDNILIMAIDSGNSPDTVRDLLDHGVNPNGQDSLGMTPLGAAILDRDPAAAKCLLTYGADAEAKFRWSSHGGSTSNVIYRPLDIAVDHHLPEIAALLRAAGALQAFHGRRTPADVESSRIKRR